MSKRRKANDVVDAARALKRMHDPLGSAGKKLGKQLEPLATVLNDSAFARLGKQLAQIDKAGALSKRLEEQQSAFATAFKPFGEHLPLRAAALESLEKHQKALERIQAVSGLGSSLSHHSHLIPNSVPPPTIDNFRLPPNPVHKTNRHLSELTEKVGMLIDVQGRQATLIDALLQAQVQSAEIQGRMARKQYLTAVIGVAVAVLLFAASIAV